MACWYGRGRSFNTSHFKGGFHPPLEPLYSKPGLSALGGCEGGGAPPRRGVARGSFPLRGIQRGACPPLRVQRRESCPPPNPSHARTLRKKGAELAREGDFYFQNNIKFFQGGSGLGCRLGRSWAVPTGHQDPLAPPGEGNERRIIHLFDVWVFFDNSPSQRRALTAPSGRGPASLVEGGVTPWA